MMTRREALKTLALSAGALAVPGLGGQATAQMGNTPGNTPGAAPAPAATPAPTGPFTLPPLPYAFDALEPHIDATTMQIHHDKHHAAYVTNLNKAVAGKPELAKMSVEQLLRSLDKAPADVMTAIRNQGGGHANHSLLWPSLKRDGAHVPSGELAAAIDKAFGSFGAFQEKLTGSAMGVFGSGWAWLTYNAKSGLAVTGMPNQDSPLSAGLMPAMAMQNQASPMSAGLVPLVGIDVWEHAYYLKYQNRRADYVAAFLQVIDWDVVSARYREALKG